MLVFPAYAGMSPKPITSGSLKSSFPRLRGDEPSLPGDEVEELRFSPPTRG